MGKGKKIDKQAFLNDVLKRYDQHITTTNFKVALLMSFLGVVTFGLLSRLFDVDPPKAEDACLHMLLQIFTSVTVLISLYTAFTLLRVVFPNTSSDSRYRSLIFFGDVASFENGAEGYLKKVKAATKKSLNRDLATQTYEVAKIVSKKFSLLQHAVTVLKFGVMPALTVSMLLQVIYGVLAP